MKYMGSKRAMLTNGLGSLIQDVSGDRTRFVDLFTGSAAVAKFVATRKAIPVLATDLQRYATLLAGAVIHRDAPIETEENWKCWLAQAKKCLDEYPDLIQLADATFTTYDRHVRDAIYFSHVELTRDICAVLPEAFPLTAAYGGHYFGLAQGLWLDALRRTVPGGIAGEVATAALIEAASECSASPGHTAQPFSPTRNGIPHLIGAWSRNIVDRTRIKFIAIGAQFAKVKGVAKVGDAVVVANELNHSDLVFVDPPYSEVQYSRFYHVLEGISLGHVNEAEGIGRYPKLIDRPQSNFSRKTPAIPEFEKLMRGIADAGAHALVTFPEGQASNGLSGTHVEQVSGQYFQVVRRVVESTFSTLGGTGANRSARQGTKELILHLVPRGAA